MKTFFVVVGAILLFLSLGIAVIVGVGIHGSPPAHGGTWADRVQSPRKPAAPTTMDDVVKQNGTPDGQGRDDSGKLAAEIAGHPTRHLSIRWITYSKAGVQFFFLLHGKKWELVDYRDAKTGEKMLPEVMAWRMVTSR